MLPLKTAYYSYNVVLVVNSKKPLQMQKQMEGTKLDLGWGAGGWMIHLFTDNKLKHQVVAKHCYEAN